MTAAAQKNSHSAAYKRKQIAAIHAKAKQLGMDTNDKSATSEYRQMLATVTGQNSTTQMTPQQRGRVIDHLTDCGAPLTGNQRQHRAKNSGNSRAGSELIALPDNYNRNGELTALRYAADELGYSHAYLLGIAKNLQRSSEIPYTGSLERMPSRLLHNLHIAVKKAQRRWLYELIKTELAKHHKTMEAAESWFTSHYKTGKTIRNSENGLREFLAYIQQLEKGNLL